MKYFAKAKWRNMVYLVFSVTKIFDEFTKLITQSSVMIEVNDPRFGSEVIA
jgi:hypothetical protein